MMILKVKQTWYANLKCTREISRAQLLQTFDYNFIHWRSFSHPFQWRAPKRDVRELYGVRMWLMSIPSQAVKIACNKSDTGQTVDLQRISSWKSAPGISQKYSGLKLGWPVQNTYIAVLQKPFRYFRRMYGSISMLKSPIFFQYFIHTWNQAVL